MKEPRKKYKTLNIKCTDSNCPENLHCFRASKKMIKAGEKGLCRTCKVSLVDWERVHKQEIGDVSYTFQTMKFEMIRHHFWHIELDQHAINYAKRKGKIAIKAAIEKRLRQSIGDAEPFKDGTQTPMKDNPICYAQHATATCCRKCLEYWHGIKAGVALTNPEIEYLSKLVGMYIEEKLPNLTDDGEYVPAIRDSESE